MTFTEYISIDPEIRFGRPCIIGTRISVYDVLGWISNGMSIDDILEDYPELHLEHIQACFAYAAHKERYLRVAS